MVAASSVQRLARGSKAESQAALSVDKAYVHITAIPWHLFCQGCPLGCSILARESCLPDLNYGDHEKLKCFRFVWNSIHYYS